MIQLWVRGQLLRTDGVLAVPARRALVILVIGDRSKIGPALFEDLLAVASGCGRLFVLVSPDG
jgi:hypothetical protein